MEILPLPSIIDLRNVNQSYDDGKSFIIQDLNFTVRDKPNRGQFVAILGPSGCGKSTLLRYIAGLQKPSGGEIFLHNKLRTDQDRVGMVFQKYSSFPWMTVIQNIELPLAYKGVPKKERREQAMEMLKLVRLEGHENKYAQYPTLSGGQLQRVAIARSLLANPKILLMDEPFGALDVNTRLAMQETILSIWRNFSASRDGDMTVVFVTHDISEAVYLADDIMIMKANPGQFVHHIELAWPVDRTIDLKRSVQFQNIVQDTEKKMMEVR